jgi:hypothetical protein
MVRDLDAARALCEMLTAKKKRCSPLPRAPLCWPRATPAALPRVLRRHSLARRLSALRALAASALRRPASGAGDDLRQPQRRAHRHRQRRSARALGGIADAFLMHDREILQRCDDSVAAIVDGAPQLIRRARGFVPLGVACLSMRRRCSPSAAI